MPEDRFRRAAKDGRTLLNAWLTLNSPFLIELIGEAGRDCLTIDQQHGLGGNDVLLQCLPRRGLRNARHRARRGERSRPCRQGARMPGRKGSCAPDRDR
jgi:4-hydroxy-2-oxoheptanedioate aldolase